MTNYENDHLNPPNEPDKETTDCEYCIGDGWINGDGFIYPETEQLTCPKCKGLGFIEY